MPDAGARLIGGEGSIVITEKQKGKGDAGGSLTQKGKLGNGDHEGEKPTYSKYSKRSSISGKSPDQGPTCEGPRAMSTASVDVFSGRRALVASVVDPRAIRGPGLLLKQGLIGRSGSSRGQGSRRERNGERDRTMGG